AIQCECRLEFGYGLLPSILRVQYEAFDEMRIRAAGLCCQGLADQPFRTSQVARGLAGCSNEHAADELVCQSDLCLHGLRIERQRVLERADLLCLVLTRIRLQPRVASAENVVQRVGMLSRPGGFVSDQLDAQRVG